MPKLREVEIAKELMAEATRWSVMKWLREKKKVRQTADRANAALDQLSEKLRRNWSDDVRNAYDALGENGSRASNQRLGRFYGEEVTARNIKNAEDEAHGARMDAEETFDRAERLLSTTLAREGCGKAIRSWELKEKAIRLAETVGGSHQISRAKR